jgi:hypothetical protein
MLPPAPTPSFANPSENAFNPGNLEFSSRGFTAIAGISAISETRVFQRPGF